MSDCYCYKCAVEYDKMFPPQSPFSGRASMFIVCSKCGNKRCPKAADHNLECTGSNEPGQKGSLYE